MPIHAEHFPRRARALVLRFVAAASTCVVLASCGSGTDQRAMDGVEAFRQCDIRGAHEAFDDAFAMSPDRADVALGFALSDLALLAEDPALQELAPRLGFSAPIDTTFVWGSGGVLEQLSSGQASCNSLADFVEAHVPHPSLSDGGPSLADTWDETLTLGEVRSTLDALAPRLERLESALVVAASGMEEGGVVLEGGCGIAARPTRVQRPELLALAAGIAIVRAAIQASHAYDGELRARLLFTSYGHEEPWVAMMNGHFLHVTDASQLEPARALLTHGIELALMAVDAAMAVTTREPDAVFDWTAMPDHVLADARTMGEAALASLDADAPTPIPFIDPTLAFDSRSFFSDPFSLEGAAVWSIASDDYGYTWIETSDAIGERLGARFTPDPWSHSAISFHWELLDRWDGIGDVLGDVLDPGDRWTGAYSCGN